jgi:hypothetical protein
MGILPYVPLTVAYIRQILLCSLLSIQGVSFLYMRSCIGFEKQTGFMISTYRKFLFWKEKLSIFIFSTKPKGFPKADILKIVITFPTERMTSLGKPRITLKAGQPTSLHVVHPR